MLAEAAEKVGTPQIRNAGTLAGNVCQRPWCWYFRNGFPCLKNGGNTCFSASGENQLHAIFGGGPSFIVHPSDTAPALVALDAKFHIAGPSGERVVPASEFFQLPRVDAARENVLAKDEILSAIQLPAARPGTRSTYHKVLDREAWTHAVVSAAIVLEMDQRDLPQRAHRARRRRSHPVAPSESGSDADGPAHHAGTGGEGRRSVGRGRASAGEEQIQSAADQSDGQANAAVVDRLGAIHRPSRNA